MSVSFIYQDLQFYYRIDHLTRALPVIAWGCRDLPVRGESVDKEAMMTDIRNALKAYHRNRKPKADAESVANTRSCDVCDISLQGMENEGTTCNDHNFNR